MENQPSSRKLASTAAYVGAFLFLVLIILFNTLPECLAIPFVAVAFHVALFPVVAELPSTEWARAAGYGWLIQIPIAIEMTCTVYFLSYTVTFCSKVFTAL